MTSRDLKALRAGQTTIDRAFTSWREMGNKSVSAMQAGNKFLLLLVAEITILLAITALLVSVS